MQTSTGRAARAVLIGSAVAATAACGDRNELTAPDISAAAGASNVVASVNGSGHLSRPDGTSRIFTLSARKYADGTVSGTYNLEIAGHDTPVRVKGNITCLVVAGSSAYIGGDVDRFDTNPFPTVPGGIAVEIIDNGEGGGASRDLLSPAFFTETQQEVLDYCADPAPGPVSPTDRGNFQVR
ncbi:MAG: hypothetical protein ABIQ49_04495 [Gemmatimonadales bacterium]